MNYFLTGIYLHDTLVAKISLKDYVVRVTILT